VVATETARGEEEAAAAAIGPYTLPSLNALFPNLEMLTIRNHAIKEIPVFLGELTDLPSKLTQLSIVNTHIKNIGEIIQSCSNLRRLHLFGNMNPINMIRLPPILVQMHMHSERMVHPLPVSTTLNELICQDSSLPEGIANVNPKILVNLLISGCTGHPYENEILGDATTVARYHARYRHINRINAERMCLQFGSIPKRIRLTHEDDQFNPIIVGLCLASNTARRMAEFVAMPSIP
jgi:Leucine-rich repeat (LRR) protein